MTADRLNYKTDDGIFTNIKNVINNHAYEIDNSYAVLTGRIDNLDNNVSSSFQPLNSNLTAIAALTTTPFGLALLTETNQSSIKTTLGLNNVENVAASATYLPLAGGTLVGALVGTSATFSGNIIGNSLTVPGGNGYFLKNTAGTQNWLYYNGGGTNDNHYLRDLINSRMHVSYVPGATSALATTTFASTVVASSTLQVGGSAAMQGTFELSSGFLNIKTPTFGMVIGATAAEPNGVCGLYHTTGDTTGFTTLFTRFGGVKIGVEGNNAAVTLTKTTGAATFSGDVTISKTTPLLAFSGVSTAAYHGLEWGIGAIFDASIKHQASSGILQTKVGRSVGWGGKLLWTVDTVDAFRMDGTSFYPDVSNTATSGLSSRRWANVYSVLGNFSGAITSGITGTHGSITFISGASNAATGIIGVPSWDTNAIAIRNAFLSETAANTALSQDNAGGTRLNAASGQSLSFRIGGVEAGSFGSSSIFYANNSIRVGTAVTNAPWIFPFSGSAHTAVDVAGRGLTLFSSTLTAGETSFAISGSAMTATSGVNTHLYLQRSILPTSGTGVFNFATIAPNINQTGGANGVTRSLYIIPGLTAVADHRAVEIGNVGTSIALKTGTGPVQFGDYVATVGSLGVGSGTSAPNAKFEVIHTASGMVKLNNTSTAADGVGAMISGMNTNSDFLAGIYFGFTGGTATVNRRVNFYSGGDSATPKMYLDGAGSFVVSNTNTNSGSVPYAVQITRTYNQTGTAGSTDLLINRTETALGSGAHNLIDAQVASVSKFTVSRTGAVIETLSGSAVTLSVNQQFAVEATSNTTGNLVYRGTDGVTRRAAITFV